jgi:hypothetical protein
MTRRSLKNRRAAETFDLELQGGGLKFTCTAGRFADGRLAEVFLSSHHVNSQAGIMASDHRARQPRSAVWLPARNAAQVTDAGQLWSRDIAHRHRARPLGRRAWG